MDNSEIFGNFDRSPTTKKDKNLSFAGAWKDIEETTFNDLTDKLIEKRQQKISS